MHFVSITGTIDAITTTDQHSHHRLPLVISRRVMTHQHPRRVQIILDVTNTQSSAAAATAYAPLPSRFIKTLRIIVKIMDTIDIITGSIAVTNMVVTDCTRRERKNSIRLGPRPKRRCEANVSSMPSAVVVFVLAKAPGGQKFQRSTPSKNGRLRPAMPVSVTSTLGKTWMGACLRLAVSCFFSALPALHTRPSSRTRVGSPPRYRKQLELIWL